MKGWGIGCLKAADLCFMDGAFSSWVLIWQKRRINLPPTSSMNLLSSFSELSPFDLMTSGRSQLQFYCTVDQILIYEFQNRNLQAIAKLFFVELVFSKSQWVLVKAASPYLLLSHYLFISVFLCPQRHRHIHKSVCTSIHALID